MYACAIVVLYWVDIEVQMSKSGFKCRAAFVEQSGNPVHFFTNSSVNVSSFFRWLCDIVWTVSRNRIEEIVWTICLKNVWTMYEQCMHNVWTMHEQCMHNAWKMCEPWMNNVWTMCKQWMNSVWKMCKQSVNNVWTMNELCVNKV